MKITPAKDILTLTEERRETLARELFGYERVTENIVAAATKGEGYLRLAQTVAASLRTTKVARQLIEQLKTAGYQVEWVSASESERSNGKETGGFIQYEELRITWATVRIHSGPQVSAAE